MCSQVSLPPEEWDGVRGQNACWAGGELGWRELRTDGAAEARLRGWLEMRVLEPSGDKTTLGAPECLLCGPAKPGVREVEENTLETLLGPSLSKLPGWGGDHCGQAWP